MTRPIQSTTIAEFIGADHIGPAVPLTGVDSLEAATTSELAFAVHTDVTPIARSGAGAVICRAGIDRLSGRTLLTVDNPRLGYAKASQRYFGDSDSTPSVHPTAAIADGAEIGDRVRIGAHVFVDENVTIGDGCIIRAGATIGCSGFGFERDEDGVPIRLAHRGGVTVGDGVEIGPNTSIDRGVFDDTEIGDYSKLSANVHLAHEVVLGEHNLITFGVGFGGGAEAGDAVMVHPNAAVAEGVTIGDGVTVGMGSNVLRDVPDGATVAGTPAEPIEKRPTQGINNR